MSPQDVTVPAGSGALELAPQRNNGSMQYYSGRSHLHCAGGGLNHPGLGGGSQADSLRSLDNTQTG